MPRSKTKNTPIEPCAIGLRTLISLGSWRFGVRSGEPKFQQPAQHTQLLSLGVSLAFTCVGHRRGRASGSAWAAVAQQYDTCDPHACHPATASSLGSRWRSSKCRGQGCQERHSPANIGCIANGLRRKGKCRGVCLHATEGWKGLVVYPCYSRSSLILRLVHAPPRVAAAAVAGLHLGLASKKPHVSKHGQRYNGWTNSVWCR